MSFRPLLSRRQLLGGSLAAAGASVLTACGGRSTASQQPATSSSTAASPTPAAPTTARPPNPAGIQANELGMVPILMHHRVVENVESDFDMTPAYFRAELERLHAEGYHPIRTVDLVRRSFHVPAGKSPVVLTFDDGSPGQFGYSVGTTVKPDTGVGILLDFHREHPDFPAVASLYINSDPYGFSTPQAVATGLSDLVQRGFEIGNHTYHHVDLGSLSSAQVQAEFAKVVTMVSTAVPGYRPSTMALPFGVEPHVHAAAAAGSADGVSYRNDGVLLVGANPSHSPYHSSFDAQQLPRIRASSFHGGGGQFLATYWLDYLKAHPSQRYVSAGNPGHVTAPKTMASELAPAYQAQAVFY